MVRIFVGVTDNDWFRFLAARQPDEVNFWSPSGRPFRALSPGELFLFKLHAPENYVVGGGVFSHSSVVPLSLAWDSFGLNNGVGSLAEMRARIFRYRGERDSTKREPQIGCRILTSPFFWPRDMWLAAPSDWASQTVVGKTYSSDEAEGRRLWSAVIERSVEAVSPHESPLPIKRYGNPTLIRPRLGQGAFRVLVTDAYQRRCSVTGERTLPILDAAHIQSFSEGGLHEASNGLLLRTDIHKLFDLGYVTVDEGRRFLVSKRLREDFDNGKHYYDLHGSELRPPGSAYASPSPASLSWHRENRFLG